MSSQAIELSEDDFDYLIYLAYEFIQNQYAFLDENIATSTQIDMITKFMDGEQYEYDLSLQDPTESWWDMSEEGLPDLFDEEDLGVDLSSLPKVQVNLIAHNEGEDDDGTVVAAVLMTLRVESGFAQHEEEDEMPVVLLPQVQWLPELNDIE